MIFEGSCDTEDWSNDPENSAFHHRNKFNFQIFSNRYFNNISLYFWHFNHLTDPKQLAKM